MTGKRIAKQHHAIFDSSRKQDAAGNKYWPVRKLAKMLEYSEYRYFQPVIARSWGTCQVSGYTVTDHF